MENGVFVWLPLTQLYIFCIYISARFRQYIKSIYRRWLLTNEWFANLLIMVFAAEICMSSILLYIYIWTTSSLFLCRRVIFSALNCHAIRIACASIVCDSTNLPLAYLTCAWTHSRTRVWVTPLPLFRSKRERVSFLLWSSTLHTQCTWSSLKHNGKRTVWRRNATVLHCCVVLLRSSHSPTRPK